MDGTEQNGMEWRWNGDGIAKDGLIPRLRPAFSLDFFSSTRRERWRGGREKVNEWIIEVVLLPPEELTDG